MGAGQTVKTAVREEGTRIVAGDEETRLQRSEPGLWNRWKNAPRGARRATLAGAVVAVVFTTVLAYRLAARGDGKSLRPEPDRLGRQPIEASFGVGSGVDYQAVDSKAFDFEFFAAELAVGLLHFQARDISPKEVAIAVNGVEIATVPPDAIDTAQATHEVVIPAKLLRKGEKNRIVFDNVKNPPGHEAWRIWNLWIEVYSLPDLPTETALAEANEAFRRGRQKWEGREIDTGNRHSAWREFRNAWLLLEGHPDPKSVELYSLTRDSLREAQRDLDRMCDKLLLEAHTAFQHKKLAEARATLDQVRRYFPDQYDQPCWRRAERNRTEYGL